MYFTTSFAFRIVGKRGEDSSELPSQELQSDTGAALDKTSIWQNARTVVVRGF